MSNNGQGQSYQKFDGATGVYQPINASDSGDLSERSGRGNEKWIIGAVASILIACIYFITNPMKDRPQTVMNQAMQDNRLEKDSKGNLKLFDELSKSRSLLPVRSLSFAFGGKN